MKVEQVGTVELLRTRNYPIDGESSEPRVEAIVEPGIFPLYREGGSYFWMMAGKLNGGGMRRMGDGLLIQSSAPDDPLDVEVVFPSRRLGSDEFADLSRHLIAREGHAEQRLRIEVTS